MPGFARLPATERAATKERDMVQTPDIPAPELIELDASWSPWRYQVNTFGDGAQYGSQGVIRTGMSNFETREMANKYYSWATVMHHKHRRA